METTLPTQSENGVSVVKHAEFAAYRIWRNIPIGLRFPPKDPKSGERPAPRDFAQALGIEDEMILDLIGLQTQEEFAARFSVSRDTLTDWNKKLAKLPEDQELRRWATLLTKNMLFAIYSHAMRKGNPLLFRLWLEFVQKFNPTLKTQHTERRVAQVIIKQDHERITAPE